MDPKPGQVLDKSQAESFAEGQVRAERLRIQEMERKRRQAEIDAKRGR